MPFYGRIALAAYKVRLWPILIKQPYIVCELYGGAFGWRPNPHLKHIRPDTCALWSLHEIGDGHRPAVNGKGDEGLSLWNFVVAVGEDLAAGPVFVGQTYINHVSVN